MGRSRPGAFGPSTWLLGAVEEVARRRRRAGARRGRTPAAAGSAASASTLVADPLAAVGQADEGVDPQAARRSTRAWTPIGVEQSASRRATAARSAVSSRRRRRSPIARTAADGLLVAGADLERQCALAGRRDHRVGRDRGSRSRPRGRAAAARRRRGRSRRVALGELAQPGVDVAVQLARPAGPAAPPAAGRGGAGWRSRPAPPRARPRARCRRRSRRRPGPRAPAPRRSPAPRTSSPGRSLAEWTPTSASPVEQRPLDPPHEARLVARLAVGGDLDQLGPAEHLGDHPGLGQRKRATAGGDAKGHGEAQPWTGGAAR